MKNTFRIGSSIFLLVLYSVAAGAARVSALYSTTALQNDLHSEQDSYYSALAINLFCPVAAPKNSANSISNNSPCEIKYPFGLHSDGSEASEQLLHHTFSQYLCFAGDFPIRLRKADVIFPFHYFW